MSIAHKRPRIHRAKDAEEKVDVKKFEYPPSEDIYENAKEMQNIDPENITQMKSSNEDDEIEKRNEKDFSDDVSGSDLDVPGSELDDEQEKTGNEDEENNYYSIGGDNHTDLEEEKE